MTVHDLTREKLAENAVAFANEQASVTLDSSADSVIATHDVLLLRRDGSEVFIEDSAAPIRDRNGATIGVVLVIHDVTERRRETRRITHLRRTTR